MLTPKKMSNILTVDGYNEKEAIKLIIADLVTTCLWNTEVAEAEGATPEHNIKVWREDDAVKAIIRHK